MNIAEFFLYLNDNWPIMAFCIIFSIFIYILLYKKYWISVLDPLSYMILGSCMGCAVVLFLYSEHLIDPIYFISYSTTQICFFIGFKYGTRKKKTLRLGKHKKLKDIDVLAKYVFVSAALIDIATQLMQYKLSGIPIFLSSRLNGMADADGAGILARFISICRAFTIIMGLYYLQKSNTNKQLRNFTIFYLLYVTVTFILSGSRSSFLIFGTAFFYYVMVNRESNPKLMSYLKKYEIKILCIAGVLAIIVNIVKYGDLTLGVGMLGTRVLAFGDTYFYAYPNHLIDDIDNSQPFKSIFSSFLGFFRIYPYSELPNPIGLDLFHFFSNNGDIGGPNARHNIVSYLYFGLIGGLLFSYILGWVTGYFRNLFLTKRHKTLLTVPISAYLYSSACGIETDINLYFFNINSYIIVVPIIFICAYILFFIVKTLRNPSLIKRFV